MNSITTRTKRALSGVIATLFALSLVAIPSAALAAAPSFGPEATNTSQSITVGQGLTALTASDPDGDPLTFILTAGVLPDGINLDMDGTFSGVATTVGDFSVGVTVCDSFGACATATLTVTVANQAPSFGPEATNTSQSITVGQGLTALTASDPDGDLLTFMGLGGLPDGITLDANGTFSGLATTAGTFSALIQVCDSLGACATATLTVTVVVNHPPTFGPEATNTSQAILLGEGLTALTAFDLDGDSIHFSLQGGVLPDGITLNDDGTFSGLATTTGDTSAITAVCDGSGVLCDSLTLEVTVSAPNQAPFFGPEDTNTSQDISVGEGLTALTASDPDGDALNFSLSAGSLPDGITLNADGTFSGLATTDSLFSAFIQVCDPFAACDSLTLEVTVSAPTNQAPFFGPDSTNNNQAITVGEGLTALTASDPDGDPLTFSLNGFALPDGITLNSDGTFSGLATTVGDFMALNEVCDPLGECDYVTLLVTVSAPPNQAPSFGPDSTNTSQDIAVGEGLTALTASDPDGDPLTFSTGGVLPDGITLNADGTFSGAATTAGDFSGDINVCDPSAACDTLTLTVTVTKAALSVTVDADPTTGPVDHFSKVYGTANPPFSVRYSGFAGTDTSASLGGTLGFSTTAITTSSVGAYSVTPSGLTSANYAITFVDGTLDITKAASTTSVTCPVSVVYTGSTLTPCSASYAGAGALSGTLSVSYTTNLNVGTATASATYAGDADHNGSSDSTTFAIAKATPIVTSTPPADLVYGDPIPLDPASVIPSVPGTFTYSPLEGTILHAGTHTITITFTPDDTTNYEVVIFDVSITVNPAPLAITVAPSAKTFGQDNPTFTVSYSAFANGDDFTDLTGDPVFTTAATATSGAGDYPVTVSGLASDDYAIAFLGGTLTISASPVVTPTPQPKVSTLSLANTSIEGPLGTPAQLQILLGLLLLSLGSGPLASKWLRRRFLRQR